LESLSAREAPSAAQILFNAQQLIVLCDAIRS
jgi:hypothetical protein